MLKDIEGLRLHKATSHSLSKLLYTCATVVIRLIKGLRREQRRQEYQCWAFSWVTYSQWDSMSSLILLSSILDYVIISINLYRHALARLMIQATCQKTRSTKISREKRHLGYNNYPD